MSKYGDRSNNIETDGYTYKVHLPDGETLERNTTPNEQYLYPTYLHNGKELADEDTSEFFEEYSKLLDGKHSWKKMMNGKFGRKRVSKNEETK